MLAEKIDRGEPWAPGDAEPEGDWLNDSTRPLIHAIRPRDAAQFSLRIAEQVDTRVAELPLDRLYPHEPDSPIYAGRGDHRGEHLGEIEAALRARADASPVDAGQSGAPNLPTRSPPSRAPAQRSAIDRGHCLVVRTNASPAPGRRR